jgi:hypothetical protein
MNGFFCDERVVKRLHSQINNEVKIGTTTRPASPNVHAGLRGLNYHTGSTSLRRA